MTTAITDGYGTLAEPTTFTIERLLPGPIERCWSYLVDSELRRQWLAEGAMDLTGTAPFELIWRNDDLTEPRGSRPDAYAGEHVKTSRVLEAKAPHRLAFTFGEEGIVEIDLSPSGDGNRVLLRLTHRELTRRSLRLGVSSGWHAHLDLLATKLAGTPTTPFWDNWTRLRADYDARLPD